VTDLFISFVGWLTAAFAAATLLATVIRCGKLEDEIFRLKIRVRNLEHPVPRQYDWETVVDLGEAGYGHH
jgi:hypothetical protein